jgi:hypothetical protein
VHAQPNDVFLDVGLAAFDGVNNGEAGKGDAPGARTRERADDAVKNFGENGVSVAGVLTRPSFQAAALKVAARRTPEGNRVDRADEVVIRAKITFWTKDCCMPSARD